MSVQTSLLKLGNRIFKPVKHPFNMANNGEMTYAEWQYTKGADTVACYKGKYYPEDMFRGKTVLDMGCGAAGKSMYYLSLGAERVVGVDIVERYEREAEAFALKLGFGRRFSFICASADDLPFPDGTFDTIIMNDFMEHVSDPEGALRESLRLIKPGGKIYINFPPYYHPFGAHMSDVIYTPWAHMFFSEKTLVKVYKELAAPLPDGAERVALRIATDAKGREYIGYINKMTIKRFKRMLRELDIKPEFYRELPLRPFLRFLAVFPPTREMFVKMTVCVLSK